MEHKKNILQVVWIYLIVIGLFNVLHYVYCDQGKFFEYEMFSYGLYGSIYINTLAFILNISIRYPITTFVLKRDLSKIYLFLFFIGVFELSAYLLTEDGLLVSLVRSVTNNEEYYFGNIIMLISLIASISFGLFYKKKVKANT